MENKETIVIQNADGTTLDVELITYLISEDNMRSYLVYSKGERTGVDSDEVIYIAKIIQNGEVLKIGGIADDNEWTEVQKLLKKIANAWIEVR